MKLAYKNEKDKCYGATGMAIAVVLFDAEDMLTAVNLDAEPAQMMEFTHDYYYSGNPSVSATTSWKTLVRNFNLAMGVSIGNVLCRKLVLDGVSIDRDIVDALCESAVADASEVCALEEDEARHIFDKNMNYLHRVFSHGGVKSVAHDFAGRLQRARRLSRLEILEQLHALNML